MPQLERITTTEFLFAAFPADLLRDFVMHGHAHEEHELNLIRRGRGRYVLTDGSALELTPGQTLFLPAGFWHRLVVDEPLYFQIIVLHPDIARELPGVTSNEPLSLCPSALPARSWYDPGIFKVFSELAGQAQDEPRSAEAWDLLCRRQFARLVMAQLLRLFHRETEDLPPDDATRRLWEVRDWLDRNFAREANLTELAERACLSPSHFSHLFRRQTGISPKHYQLFRRLGQAERLLAETRLSVLDVCLSVGFAHLAHFNRAFKRRTGLTPGEFRKKHQIDRRKA